MIAGEPFVNKRFPRTPSQKPSSIRFSGFNGNVQPKSYNRASSNKESITDTDLVNQILNKSLRKLGQRGEVVSCIGDKAAILSIIDRIDKICYNKVDRVVKMYSRMG